jgi:hypothetical protein
VDQRNTALDNEKMEKESLKHELEDMERFYEETKKAR